MTSWYGALAGGRPEGLRVGDKPGPPGGEEQLIALGRVIGAALAIGNSAERVPGSKND